MLTGIVGHIAHGTGESDDTVGFRFHAGLNIRTLRRTTDVEGTHGQLCTRLTDRLCRNHANCFTFVNQAAATQVTTVTFRTQTVTRITGQWRAYFHFVDTQLVDQVHLVFFEQRTGF